MPTLPFTGRAVDYARRGEVTDLVYSPSTTGLVTEIFRRMPDVVRSVHPTHSVAAWGTHAADLVHGHYLASTPCGKESPFLKLLDVDGKVLFLGASVRAMTFYHGLEELQEAELPVSPFTPEVFELQTRDNDGKLWTTRTRLFSADRRDTTLLVPVLKRFGAWHESRVGLLRLGAARCRDILRASSELTKAGRSIYPGAR
jgi:aminoglycoside 3-N-acetyltransferase